VQKRKIRLFFFSLIFMAELQAEPQLDEKKITLMLQEANHLMAEYRYQEAADILEKVLMINSTTNGAIEAYQQALSGIELQTQKILVSQLESTRYQAQETKDWGVYGKLGLNAGWGDNLNRAPADKNIKITPGEGEGELELSEEFQPQNGFGVEADASIFAVKKLSNADSVNLSLHVQNRTTNKEKFTDYVRINTGISGQHKLEAGAELGTALYFDVLRYDNKAKFYSLDLINRYAWQNNASCHSQVGIDIQWKHQKDNSIFDSIYSGGVAATNCYWWGGTYHLGLNLGNEWALDERRPGGGQQKLLVQLSHDREIGWLRAEDRINAYINIEHRQDQQGYSALLENGAKRTLNRMVVGGQYRFPLVYKENPWWLTLDVEWQKQYSNIQLFEYDALEVWLGVEVLW